jgi:imidazolonepropionase-like amidohydrolase
MKRYLPAALSLVVACAHTGPPSPAGTPATYEIDPQSALALTDITVIDGTGVPPLPGMTIVIEHDRIADIFRTGEREPPAGVTVRRLNEHYVIPGLIDAHVHVFAAPLATTDSSDVAEYLARERARLGRVLRGGVTTVRNMGGRCRATRELARQVKLGEVEAAEPYFGGVVIGPAGAVPPGMEQRRADEMMAAFQRANPGCRRVIDGPFDPQELVAAAKATGATGVKLYGDISGSAARQITEEAHLQGLMVWAHATLFPARPSELVEAGVDVLSHAPHLIWEAVDSLPDFVTRTGPLGPFDQVSPSDPAIDEVFRLMVERGAILDPTLLYYHLLTTAPDTAGQISQADRVARNRWGLDVTRRAHELGVSIVAGTDAMGAEEEDSLPNLHRELELLVSEAGLSPVEAIESATSVGARALGLENTLGTIAVGKQADLVVLRSDPTLDIRNTRDIAFVVKRGRIVAGDPPTPSDR